MNAPRNDAAREDALLLGLIVRGDSEAFAELYSRWSPMLFGLVRKILNDPRDAEDAMQDGFLHVWHRAASYDPERSSPTTWAYMIFRNKAIDRLRARERRGHGMEVIAAEEHAQGANIDTPEEGAARKETREAITEALQQIPADQREAIRLAFFAGLTQQEVADQLGAPLGTIKARIRRGLMKMASSLGGKL